MISFFNLLAHHFDELIIADEAIFIYVSFSNNSLEVVFVKHINYIVVAVKYCLKLKPLDQVIFVSIEKGESLAQLLLV